MIYEARPNVTYDVFSLCFKSGNACVLKGGKDADASNAAGVASKQDQIATAHSLGLRKIGNETVQPNNDATQGKIKKIAHLITVVEE